MTIPRDTKSYPYLAIAQCNNVDYSRVLQYSEKLVRLNMLYFAPSTQWQYEVWRLEINKLKKSIDI